MEETQKQALALRFRSLDDRARNKLMSDPEFTSLIKAVDTGVIDSTNPEIHITLAQPATPSPASGLKESSDIGDSAFKNNLKAKLKKGL